MSKIKLSDQAKSLKLGTYRHFKGHLYQVIGVGIHSETLAELVIYQRRPEEGDNLIWVRPLKMFLEEVEVDGVKKPRFQYVAQST